MKLVQFEPKSNFWSKNQSTAKQGGSRIFSRGVAVFQKNFENFVKLFGSTKLIFRALPEHYNDPHLAKISAPQTNS